MFSAKKYLNMQSLLKKHFGYDAFRPLQAEIIDNVLSGKDTFVLMPTGGGKSMCFQLPALKLKGLTLVISPLIALMKDQVDGLRANGIPAAFINSSLDAGQIKKTLKKAEAGETKILYAAPERFAASSFRDFLAKADLSLIAIDEAHCISEWGHDFRPDYRNLSILKKLFPGVPLIALTATATEKVRADILSHLSIPKARSFVSSFNRENLHIKIIEKKQAFSKLAGLLEAYRRESAIVYCFSRKETEEVAENLRLNNFKALAYHAGLPPEKRKSVQDSFVNDQTDIIVATIAFGMGIDKPDVRLVVHYTFPKTLEGYYQEIGRAGRDGLPSECVMFYTYADLRRHEYFVNQIRDGSLRQKAWEKLDQVLQFAGITACRKKYLLDYFGEKLEGNCNSCDICNTKREKFDATVAAQKIMSAILKTGSNFGRNYIIDILLGKNTQKIRINRHNELSVFGIVRDHSEDELGQIIKQLVDNGYLSRSGGRFPILGISRNGAEFLRKGAKLELAKPISDKKASARKDSRLDYNRDLFERLRELRKDLAQQENIPPFVVFGDNSLVEMACYLPLDKKAFSRISGVGAAKLDKYAEIFLHVIGEFAKANRLDPSEQAGFSKAAISKVRVKRFNSKTKELLIKKIPLERIAKRQGLANSTIINHIEKMIDAGEKIDLEYLKLPLDRFKAMEKAFTKIGDERLKPVYEHLEGRYHYDELRLARVIMRS